MNKVKWDSKEISIDKMSKIVVLSLEGYTRKQICNEIDVSMFTVWKYRRILLQ